MANLAQTTEQTQVAILLTAPIEADYRNLAAFPGLRAEQCKRDGGYRIFRVPVDFAREVLEHARDRMRELGRGRGLYQSYRAMAQKLEQAIDKVDGVCEAPGLEKWEAECRSIGCHRVNAEVFNANGEVMFVTEAYGIRQVREPKGPFRDEDGRFSYRPGYVVVVKRENGTKRFFCPAGSLYDKHGAPTHLRLVHSA